MSNWEKTMKEWDDSIPDGIKYLSAENRVLTRKARELESEKANLTARIDELEAENTELKERIAMLDVTAVFKSLGEMEHIEKVANLKAELDRAAARIAELEAERRWIPVSERLPEEGHKVLVLLTDGAISIDLIYGNDFLYENWVGDITHWMPLPEPPEVQE